MIDWFVNDKCDLASVTVDGLFVIFCLVGLGFSFVGLQSFSLSEIPVNGIALSMALMLFVFLMTTVMYVARFLCTLGQFLGKRE